MKLRLEKERLPLQDVRDRIEMEGFHYTFIGYSSFPYIKDTEFHRLREAFIKAEHELNEYINAHSEDPEF